MKRRQTCRSLLITGHFSSAIIGAGFLGQPLPNSPLARARPQIPKAANRSDLPEDLIRAWRASLIGLALLPPLLNLYSTWLLIRNGATLLLQSRQTPTR